MILHYEELKLRNYIDELLSTTFNIKKMPVRWGI